MTVDFETLGHTLSLGFGCHSYLVFPLLCMYGRPHSLSPIPEHHSKNSSQSWPIVLLHLIIKCILLSLILIKWKPHLYKSDVVTGFWRIRNQAYTHLVGGWRTFLSVVEAGIGEKAADVITEKDKNKSPITLKWCSAAYNPSSSKQNFLFTFSICIGDHKAMDNIQCWAYKNNRILEKTWFRD